MMTVEEGISEVLETYMKLFFLLKCHFFVTRLLLLPTGCFAPDMMDRMLA